MGRGDLGFGHVDLFGGDLALDVAQQLESARRERRCACEKCAGASGTISVRNHGYFREICPAAICEHRPTGTMTCARGVKIPQACRDGSTCAEIRTRPGPVLSCESRKADSQNNGISIETNLCK